MIIDNLNLNPSVFHDCTKVYNVLQTTIILLLYLNTLQDSSVWHLRVAGSLSRLGVLSPNGELSIAGSFPSPNSSLHLAALRPREPQPGELNRWVKLWNWLYTLDMESIKGKLLRASLVWMNSQKIFTTNPTPTLLIYIDHGFWLQNMWSTSQLSSHITLHRFQICSEDGRLMWEPVYFRARVTFYCNLLPSQTVHSEIIEEYRTLLTTGLWENDSRTNLWPLYCKSLSLSIGFEAKQINKT